MRIRGALVWGALALSGVLSESSSAQQVDVIRGRVTDPDSAPVRLATVTATSVPRGIRRSAFTDSAGYYTIVFGGDDGPYTLRVEAPGFADRSVTVARRGNERVLIADVALDYGVHVLDVVVIEVRAPRRRPPRGDVSDDTTAVGSRGVVSDAVSAEQGGNLAALAATLPGIDLIPGRDGNPDGFSALGLSQDQNRTTINGLATSATRIPRDANVLVSVATTPYDVSRGGFSGAQISVRTRPGSNVPTRTMSGNLSAPPLQWTDRAARSQEYSNLSIGGALAGPVRRDRSFYSVSYQVGRRLNHLQTMLSAGRSALQAAGIDRDSVQSLIGILEGAGIPVSDPRVPAQRTTDQASILAAFDIAPPSAVGGHAFNVTANGDVSRSRPSSTSLLMAMPAHDGDRTTWSGGMQGRHTNYFGVGILSETSVGLGVTANEAEPYLRAPHATVQMRSQLDDGSSAVRTIAFGGSPSLFTTDHAKSLSALNQLSWFSRNNAHRIMLTSELRYDAYSQHERVNPLGTFAYRSLVDLAADAPASFSRQFTGRYRSGRHLVGGASLGDTWMPTADLQVQYGIRLDANRFLSRPRANPAIEDQFGVRNDRMPNRIYASPRVGFAWTYGKAATYAGMSGPQRAPRPALKGGVGVFQNSPTTNLIAAAVDNTGLPNAIVQLRCVGAATPLPDWDGYIASADAIPLRCADGTEATSFASVGSSVNLFARRFAMRRSVRGNLQWSGPVVRNRFVLTGDVTYSLNVDQPGDVDLNFLPVVRFAMRDETWRPVYVPATSIVPSSGVTTARDARRVAEFSRVWAQRSDLQSRSTQMTLSVRPLSVARPRAGWNASYVLQDVREMLRGFASTSGNPLEREWAPGAGARHQFTYAVSYNLLDAVRVEWSGRVQSGVAFTPMVAGDVNGDGNASNDRAFIFDPNWNGDTAVASSMRAVADGGSRTARRCLAGKYGRLAGRNSCRGPWTTTANLSLVFDPVKFHLPPRTTMTLQVANPIGALDLLLHGERRLHGWGQNERPDQVLLYVRGFDPVAQRFRYEVNERFAATRPAQVTLRTPVVATLMFRVDVGPTRKK
jgi:hypothetical protein